MYDYNRGYYDSIVSIRNFTFNFSLRINHEEVLMVKDSIVRIGITAIIVCSLLFVGIGIGKILVFSFGKGSDIQDSIIINKDNVVDSVQEPDPYNEGDPVVFKKVLPSGDIEDIQSIDIILHNGKGETITIVISNMCYMTTRSE